MNGAGVSVENLSLSLGAFALENLDLALERDEILVILGPNGAGKSVSLEAIAGFHRYRSGRIVIGGRDVTRLAPEHRNVGLMFQDFGLFPHLTVARNIALGLGRRGRPASPARGVDALMREFGITALAARHPDTLSPGEKQRVALARALAAHPDLFLFDEPFSALDAPTRDDLRDELHHFLRHLRIPAIFVTHDRADAAILADKIIVLRQGRPVQSGQAADIFRRPVNAFVAACVGVENILAGRITGSADGRLAIAIGDRILHAETTVPGSARDVRVCIRAEDVSLEPAGPSPAAPAAPINRLAARIVAIRNQGALCRIELDCGFPLNAYVLARQVRTLSLAPGCSIAAEIEAGSIHVIAD